MQPAASRRQLFNHHGLVAVLGHQVGEGLGIVAAVEPDCAHLLGNGLLAGDLRPHAIATRSVQLGSGWDIRPGAWLFHPPILQEFSPQRTPVVGVGSPFAVALQNLPVGSGAAGAACAESPTEGSPPAPDCAWLRVALFSSPSPADADQNSPSHPRPPGLPPMGGETADPGRRVRADAWARTLAALPGILVSGAAQLPQPRRITSARRPSSSPLRGARGWNSRVQARGTSP